MASASVQEILRSEAWLYKNKESLASIEQGLKKSASGETNFLDSFACFIQE